MVRDTEDRWQTRIKSLKDGIHHIYDTKEFSDTVFIVGQKRFEAHKLVLAARCSKLAAMLLDPKAISEHIVDDESVTETGFEILLRFIYKDTLGTDDKRAIVQAYTAANYYSQRALKEKCEREIESWSISMNEVCDLLNVSWCVPALKEKCLYFIRNNAKEVIDSPVFLNLNAKALTVILENAAILEDVPIKTRIQKVVEWGAHSHTKPVDYSLVREDFLSTNPPLLGMLGLEELTLSEFNKLINVTYKGLLTKEERLQFFEYFEEKDEKLLPFWCKTDH